MSLCSVIASVEQNPNLNLNPSPKKRKYLEESSLPNKQKKTPEKTSPSKHIVQLLNSSSQSTTLTPEMKALAFGQQPVLPQSICRVLFPEIAPTPLDVAIAECTKTLQKSMCQELGHHKQRELMPKNTSEDSTSGSYFVAAQGRRMLVIKPLLQEAGGVYCPKNTQEQRKGIASGQAGVRELLAGLVQKGLNLDFGVPPVCLTTYTHPFFNNLKRPFELMRQLEKKGVSFQLVDFFLYAKNLKSSDDFAKTMLHLVIDPSLKLLRMLQVSKAEENDLIAFCKIHRMLGFTEFRAEFQRQCPRKELFQTAVQLASFFQKQNGAEVLLADLYTELSDQLKNDEAFVAAIRYEESMYTLGDLPLTERAKIPVEEFYKFVLDVALFNTDRHDANVLVKKVNLGEGKYTYRLILIDHGFCLPRIEDDVLEPAIFHFLDFQQTHAILSGKITEVFQSLDIHQFIGALKRELTSYQEKYPKYASFCQIPEECFTLLECNLHLLKKAIAHRLSLHAMCGFQLDQSKYLPCVKMAISQGGCGSSFDEMLEKALGINS